MYKVIKSNKLEIPSVKSENPCILAINNVLLNNVTKFRMRCSMSPMSCKHEFHEGFLAGI